MRMRFSGRPRRRCERIDTSQLTKPAALNAYQSTLSSELSKCSLGSIDGHWSHVHRTLLASGKSSCDMSDSQHGYWVSSQSLEFIDARRHIPVGSDHNETRKELRARLRASLKRDRESWWSHRASEMEVAAALGNHPSDGPAPWAVPLDPTSRSEVEREIGLLKLNKAAGPDDLNPALFKFVGSALIDALHELLVKLWKQETVPTDWSRSVIVPIFKGGSRSECGSHRRISLISIASKLLASIILHRRTGARESQIREEQVGFHRSRGYIENIFILRQLLEHRYTYWRPTVVVFLGIKGAFDSVDRCALWNCLLRKSVPEKYINIIRALYTRSTGRVRAYGKLSSPFNISSGVRHGYPLSPFLFNFAIDEVMEFAFAGHDLESVELLPGERLLDSEHAHDIALICDSSQTCHAALDRLALTASRFQHCFAPSKCKAFFQDWQGSPPALTLGGDQLEVVRKSNYLGSCIRALRIEDEITNRITKARSAFASLCHLWRRRDISLALKGRVYNAAVRLTLLYGCET
ncbi:unnamed protein product [Dicrocoelium dendriticum]|nr:unnamed protein product [Dicrocoelium dendriticum]